MSLLNTLMAEQKEADDARRTSEVYTKLNSIMQTDDENNSVKDIQLESNFLRSHNTQVKKEKEKREVEVQPLPAAK